MPPPPKPLAEFPERVELLTVRLPVSPLKSAPPILKAELPESVELEMVRVPMFAAPPLARALYFSTEVDQPVPESLYLAVAQVIAYVFSLADVRPGVAPMLKPQPKVPASMLFDANGKLMAP